MKTLVSFHKIFLLSVILLLAAGSQAQTVSYLWSNGATTPNIVVNPQETTTYYLTITQDGVEYFDSLVVTVTPPPVVAINGNSTVCLGFSTTLQATQGNSYLWSTGETTASITVSPSVNTSYSVEITDANGCTGIAEINVIVNQPSAATETVSACGNYTWNGATYTQSGTYTWTGTNAIGCDSVVTLNLTIIDNETSTIEVNTCGPYEWNGVVYEKSGAYNYVNSCTTQTLFLHINEITEINAQIFSGETYLFNGDVYSESGVYFDTISRIANCDSIIRLNLYVIPLLNCEIIASNDSICANEQVNLNIENSIVKVYAIKRDAFLGGNEISEFGIVNGVNLTGFAGIIWGVHRNVNFSNYLGFATETWRVEQNTDYFKFAASINYSDLDNDQIYYYKTFYINESDTIYSENTQELLFSDSVFNSMLSYGLVTDIEENQYKTISIGDQTWMAENLLTQTYSNGDPMVLEVYNGLQIYTPVEVKDSRNVCPIGWRVPNNSDWNKLFEFATNRSGVLQTYYQSDSILSWNDYWSETENVPNVTQGALLTSSNQFYTTANSGFNLGKNYFTNTTGFSSIPGDDDYQANYWSSTLNVGSTIHFPRFDATLLSPGELRIWNDYGRSIRCISNDTIYELQFPVIDSTQISEVNSTAATIVVSIENLNDAELFEKGLIISTYTSEWGDLSGLTLGFLKEIDETPFPLIDNYKIISMGSLSEDFTVDLDNLIPNMKYYVRAYVKNKYGVRYGEELNFTTSSYVNQILWSTGETTSSISVSPTETTTYSVTVTQGGQTCTSEVSITVNQPSAIAETVSACGNYTWNGNTYTQSGTYIWTGTNAAGCDSVVTLNLTITPQPEQPQLACWQTATFDAASCSWVIGGTQPVEPTDLACWETATFNANACAWVVSGAQPEQPTNLACYETALFVDTLCNWVVTGTPAPAIVTNASACVSYTWEANGEAYSTTGQYSFNSNCQEFVLNLTIDGQPAQPQLACWQTATFDAASCSWVISGTQPAEPTDLTCWETATFNANACAWVISGTQPEQPTNLACYETALFVDTLCNWVVTGTPAPAIVTNASACVSYTWEANGETYSTSGQYSFNNNCQEFVLNLTIDGQPEQPQIACWQTATFDAASCSWVIGGTQPVEPTDLACWETATFNANACAWVVSGAQPEQPTNLACYETALFVDTLCNWVVTGTPAPAIVTNASACVSYTWEANGATYNSSGQYSFNSNCQDYILNLTINQASTSTISASITQGETYSFNGQNLTTAGTYTATLQNAAGCDSVVTLNLTVEPAIEPLNCAITTSDAEICLGQSTNLTVPFSPSAGNVLDTIFNRYSAFEYSFQANGSWKTEIGGWQTGNAPFGNTTGGEVDNNAPEFAYNTFWPTGSTLFVRKSFNLNGFSPEGVRWKLGVDNGYNLFVNGNFVSGIYEDGFTSTWEYEGLIPAQYLNSGDNIIALELTDGGFLTAFDMMLEGNRNQAETSILWSTGETTPSISVSPTETTTYSVTVTQGGQTCTSEVTITVNQPSAETVNATITEGESYSFNGQSLTTAGTYTATLQNAAGCDSVVTLNLTVNPAPVGGCYASTVINFSQGQRADAANVAAIRSNPEQALGMPEPVVTNVVNFVSLGFGGSITLAFEAPIANGAGNDIRIDEATWGNNPCDRYPESADVFASQDGSNFVYLGRVCQDAELDLGPLSWAQYVRIVDASDLLSFNADADGYDVNGVSCLNGAATSLNNDGLVACTLQEVVSYQPGMRKNGSAVGAPRNNAANALGMPQNNNTINFVALGFGGVLEARFDYVVFNQPGNELRVTETSFGNPSCTNYPEKARVSVSLDGNTWTELGEICQDGELDLGTLPYAQYIRVQDASPMSSNKFNGSADGFDVDAVVVLNNGCGMNNGRLAALDNTQTADEEISFSLYPNPMEDYTILRWEGLDSDAAFRLELFDAAGRVVRSADIEVRGNEYLFRAADLAPGVYQVVISNEKQRFSARLLK